MYLNLEETNLSLKEVGASYEEKDCYPLSKSQEGLWFIYQLIPDAAFYNVPYASKIEGQFDIDVFKKAVHHLIFPKRQPENEVSKRSGWCEIICEPGTVL